MTITVQPFRIDSEKLVLTTLTTGAGPDRSIIGQLTE